MLVFLVLACCALLTAVLALALLREIRLRKALAALLQKILKTWRSRFHDKGNGGNNDSSAGSRDAADTGKL